MSATQMLKVFIPQYAFREITDISREFLEQLGLRFIILDLDNTIAEYKEPTPPENVIKWAEGLKSQGVELFIVSNSKRKERVESFGHALGISVTMKARKPSPEGIVQAINTAGFSAENSALIGDQVFTDMIAANRSGIVSIVIQPRRLTNPFHTVRYALETPFRALCRNKYH